MVSEKHQQRVLSCCFLAAIALLTACGKLGYDAELADDALSLLDASPKEAAPKETSPSDTSPNDATYVRDVVHDWTRFGDASPSGCPAGITTSGIQFETQQYGGNGGTAYSDVCPAGEVVIGFSGYTTTTAPIVVGWLQTLCGKLSIAPTRFACSIAVLPGTMLSGRGQIGGMGPCTQACPQDQVVVGFHGRAGFDLDQVSFECAPLQLSSRGPTTQVTIGPITSLPPEGGTTGPTFQEACPPGEVVLGTSSEAGAIVYKLGLSCATPVVVP